MTQPSPPTSYQPVEDTEIDLLDEDETAAIIRVQPGTLRVWRSTGRYDLPYVKVGRLVRYERRRVLEFIMRHTRRHQGDTARQAQVELDGCQTISFDGGGRLRHRVAHLVPPHGTYY